MTVADRSGIALFVTGRVPIRRAGDGSTPVAGADGAHDWIGWASGAQLPNYIAPASGRLVNANERVAPADFPVFLGHDWFGDWRARRIRELLTALPTRRRRISCACSSTSSARSRATCCPPCWRCMWRMRARWWPRVAAQLGRQHGARPASAADLHRMARAVRRPNSARREDPAEQCRTTQRVRGLRAVSPGATLGRHALVRW